MYKQICKCQITEGDAETGEQSDTFSKKTNKQTNIQAPIIAFTSLLLHFPFFDFFVFPSTVTSVIEEKTVDCKV